MVIRDSKEATVNRSVWAADSRRVLANRSRRTASEKQLATWTAISYSSDHIFDYIELDEDYAIFEISVPSAWVGRTIGKLDIRRTHGVNIMATKIDGKMNMSITADYVFSENETILVLGKMKEIQKCFRI